MRNWIIAGIIGVMSTFLPFWMWDDKLEHILVAGLLTWIVYVCLLESEPEKGKEKGRVLGVHGQDVKCVRIKSMYKIYHSAHEKSRIQGRKFPVSTR